MINIQTVTDHFGQQFRILTLRDEPAPSVLKAEKFYSEMQASRFIQRLSVTPGFWRKMLSSIPQAGAMPSDQRQLIDRLAWLFVRGIVLVYKVDQSYFKNGHPKKKVLSDNENNQHIFTHVSALLTTRPLEYLSFSSKKEAKNYLNKLSAKDESIQSIIEEFDLSGDSPKGVLAAPKALDIVAEGLTSGEVVVVVDKKAAPPTPDKKLEIVEIVNKVAGLGPAAAAPVVDAAEVKHLCILNKMELSCKHGRSVTLDPATAINPETGNAVVKYLAVTSASAKSDTKNQELLTAKIGVNDKCDSHTRAPYTITSDSVQLVGENFGDVIKFYSPGQELNLSTEFYKYLWLPSIKPISYKVMPPDFCDMSKFDGKAKSIRVDVYPDIKWDIGLDIGFGKIEVEDSSPGDKKKAADNVIEEKIKQDEFSVNGHAKCTHGGDTLEFGAELKNKFDVIKYEIEGQNALLSKIFGKFQDGDNHAVSLDLPKLAFSGTSSVAEKKGSPDVDVKWDYNIKAAPLIGMKASVDILPMLLRKSGWGSLFLPLLRELKDKYANPDGSVGVQLEASIILSIEGKVEFDLKFTDQTFVHDEKTELRSLRFDVPFQCKGELKGKGHILVFSAELGVMAKLQSGFAYEMLMGADSKGIYRSSILHFHGLVFEIKAYIESKMELPGKNNKKNKKSILKDMKSKNKIKSNVGRRKEYGNKWTWIENGQKEFSKNYIVKNS